MTDDLTTWDDDALRTSLAWWKQQLNSPHNSEQERTYMRKKVAAIRHEQKRRGIRP